MSKFLLVFCRKWYKIYTIMLSNGYIDLQVNGFMNVDFSSENLTSDTFAQACRLLMQKNTAAFMPTLITSPEQTYRRNLPIIAEVAKTPPFRDLIIGLHIEGPFLSPLPGAAGAHNPAYMKKPDIKFLEQLQNWANGLIKIVTIAAELPGSDEFTRCATKMGINIFLGHQMAGYDDLKRLARCGAKAITHLGNGLPQDIDRHNNVLWAALAVDELAATVIADGNHLPAHLIKAIIRAKGIDNIAVISDVSPLGGLPPGKYETLGNEVILREDGLIINPKIGYFVGSSRTISECVEFLQTCDFIRPGDIEKLAIRNPLRIIGRN